MKGSVCDREGTIGSERKRQRERDLMGRERGRERGREGRGERAGSPRPQSNNPTKIVGMNGNII